MTDPVQLVAGGRKPNLLLQRAEPILFCRSNDWFPVTERLLFQPNDAARTRRHRCFATHFDTMRIVHEAISNTVSVDRCISQIFDRQAR